MIQPQTPPKMSLADISTKGNGLPARIMLYAVEGWGKTSFGTQFPKPIFIEVGGETGLETLIDSGQVAQTPHFPSVKNWMQLLDAVNLLKTGEHDYETLVLDTINGAERLNHEAVCMSQFGGDWGEKGFASYQTGYLVSLKPWENFLCGLEDLRQSRKMRIVMLCHSKISSFDNPDGGNYKRYEADLHWRTWGETKKWADMVLFGNYHTVVKNAKGVEDGKGPSKGYGGNQRYVYTERCAAYDAKHRHGLPQQISFESTPKEAYLNFTAAVKAGRGKQNVST